MMSLCDDKQADVIDAFNTTSRYLDDILNIGNVYFDNMVSRANRGLSVGLFCSGIQFYLLLSPYLCFISFLYLDLYVPGDDVLIS